MSDEVARAWARLKAAPSAAAFARSLKKGAREAALRNLEEELERPLPADLRASLLLHDGQGGGTDDTRTWDGHWLLSVKEISDALQDIGPGSGDDDWLIVGLDDAQGALFVDLESGQVISGRLDEVEHRTRAASWLDWLERFAAGAEAGPDWAARDPFLGEPWVLLPPEPEVEPMELVAQASRQAEVGALAAALETLDLPRGDPDGAVALHRGALRLARGEPKAARKALKEVRGLVTRMDSFGTVRWVGPGPATQAAALDEALERGGPPPETLPPVVARLVGWGAVSAAVVAARARGGRKALEDADAALAAAPDDPLARLRRGLRRLLDGEPVEAVMDLARVLAAFPGHPLLRGELGAARAATGDPRLAAQARADLEAGLAAGPDPTTAKAWRLALEGLAA